MQAHHAGGGVAGLDEVFLAERVGLALVLARVAGEQGAGADLPAHAHQPAPVGILRRHVEARDGRLRDHVLPLALGGVAGVDVAELVAEQGGELGLVVEVGKDAARHTHRAAGEGVGVDVVGVEHAVGVGHLRAMREHAHALADAGDVAVDRFVLDGAEVLRELVRRDLGVGLNLLRLAHADEDGLAGDRRGGAAGEACSASTQQPQRLAAGDAVALEAERKVVEKAHGIRSSKDMGRFYRRGDRWGSCRSDASRDLAAERR